MENTAEETVFKAKENEIVSEKSTASSETPSEDKINVLEVEVTNENVALNILVTFVNLAQKRGAFNLNESAKIWECIQMFQRSSKQ
tara:strand:+ start:14969 stop:15226 length:258 start_codon:yes stop_codon:yes gene_type:complete